MGGENEEDTKDIAYPREGVQEVYPSRCILRDEEVEQGQRHRVTTEHIVSARSHSLITEKASRLCTCNKDIPEVPRYLQSHASTCPDDVGVVKLVVDIAVWSRGAPQVLSGHAQRGNQHRHAAEEKNCAAYRKETAHQDESKFHG